MPEAVHHPEYRSKYVENLKRELPRIPLAPDFMGFSQAGKELARLHIEYEQLEPWPLQYIETTAVGPGLSPDRAVREGGAVAAGLSRHGASRSALRGGGVKPPLRRRRAQARQY